MHFRYDTNRRNYKLYYNAISIIRIEISYIEQ